MLIDIEQIFEEVILKCNSLLDEAENIFGLDLAILVAVILEHCW